MDNITKSLFNLTRTNNGLFKSQKQADFLKSCTVDGSTFWGSGSSTYGNVTQQVFFLDSEGVTAVKTWSQKKQKFTRVGWERKSNEAFKTLKAAKVVADEKKAVLRVKIDKIHNRVDELRNLRDNTLAKLSTNLVTEFLQETEGKTKEEVRKLSTPFMERHNRIKKVIDSVEPQIRRLFEKASELEQQDCKINSEYRKLYANTK